MEWDTKPETGKGGPPVAPTFVELLGNTTMGRRVGHPAWAGVETEPQPAEKRMKSYAELRSRKAATNAIPTATARHAKHTYHKYSTG